MVKSITPEMDDHLEGEVTTLARCWAITRLDGTGFYFTDFDDDLLFETNTYLSSVGLRASAIANNAGLDVDNLEVDGFFDSDTITEEALRAGLFDYAEVKVFYVNWMDLSQGRIRMRRGRLGEVIFSELGFFKSEIRGLTQALQQKIGELYAPECRTDLGDARCGIPLAPNPWIQEHTYAVGESVRHDFDSGDPTTAKYQDVIFVVTVPGVSLSVEPTWDTTIGNDTVESGSAATATLTFTTGDPSNGGLVAINGVNYHFETVISNLLYGDVHIVPGNLASSIANLCAAINHTGTPGTDYSTATTANVNVTATCDATHLYITAITAGTIANGYPLNEVLSNASWSGANMSGGLDGVTWTATEAWTRGGIVAGVTDRAVFTATIVDPRAVDGWFDGGTVRFETGQNAGRSVEIKSWVQSGGHLEMELPFGYLPAIGDAFSIYPGCDKSPHACSVKFSNILNMRAEPYLPGQDQVLLYPDAKA